METNVTKVSASSVAKNSEKISPKAQKEITAGEKYGTFDELVARLGKLGKAGEKEKYKENGYVTKYYDTEGNFVGGTYTRPGKDRKYTGTVTIGTVTYTAEDIKGKGTVKNIFDNKKGIYASDRNNDGIINPGEITRLGPPTL